jgi:uncharacterized protein YjbK
MQKETETEYKFLVNKEQFEKYFALLVRKYGKATTKLQINYYYDTEGNTLNKENVTVRVRQENDRIKWQIKRHTTKYGALFSSDEYCGSLDFLPGIIKLNEINEELILKGSLITERRTISFGAEGKLCFDSNMYLGASDYEIEVEYSEQDKSSGDAIAAIIDSDTKVTGETKSNRFFKQWEAINNGKGAITIC